MPTEVELKLALAPEAVARLRRHALLKGVAHRKRALLSVYFDTPGHLLSRRGIALRLRRVGYRWVQTLKAESASAGALSSRSEWEVQVTGNQPDLAVLPAEARTLLGDIAIEDLRPCFSTDFSRTTWHLGWGGSELELALDRGEIRAGVQNEPISEVELELKTGESGILYEVAARLLETLPLCLEPRSKALRGYTMIGVHDPTPIRAEKVKLRPGQDARSAWQAMFGSALAQMIANVPGAMAGLDPEYLHQLRVAVRRLTTTLSLGRDLGLDPPGWLDDLHWLMAELSPARDWDVFVAETLSRVSAHWDGEAGLVDLRELAMHQRERANARARSALQSSRFVGLVLTAEKGWSWPETGLDLDVQTWARRALSKRLKKVRRLGRGFARLDAAGRHRLRIAAKRLRYSADAFASLHRKGAAAYLARLSRLQDALGVANDLAVAHGLLVELASIGQAHATGLVEGYLVREAQSRAQRLDRRYKRFKATKPFWD